MAEPEVRVNDTPAESTPAEDVEMLGAEGEEGAEPASTGEAEAEAGAGAGEEGSTLPDVQSDTPKRTTFLDYLKSHIIEIVVGTGEEQTKLTAHQDLLTKSPFFAEQCAQFAEDSLQRRIELPNEDLEATGSLLEYLYHGEYFPKRISDSKDSPLETDPSVPASDDEGVALLKHARVYALADKFGLPTLKSLAHSKIHRTSSTAKGEIAYARFVYRETSPDDKTIRKPVAAFWATRSHVLRHEAEAEFRSMCLEFPQFGFDVLSLVLDQKEKRKGGDDGPSSTPGAAAGERSARKRARVLV